MDISNITDTVDETNDEHNDKNTIKNKNNDENDYDDNNHIHDGNEILKAMATWSSEIN